jgi:hypothetical protein
MQRFFRCGGLLCLSLALILPAFTSAQDTKKDDTKKDVDPLAKTKGKDKDKLKVKADWKYAVDGKITALDDKDDTALTFTLRVKVPQPNPDGEKQLASAQQSLIQHQQQLAKAKNLQDRQNALNAIGQDQINIQKAQANLVKFTDQDMLFKEKSNMRVRYYVMPPGIDTDTGESIKYTDSDKEKAKGTEGYPGYKADKKVLKTDQVVRVFYNDKDLSEVDKAKKTDDIKTAQENARFVTVMIYVPDQTYFAEPKK